MITCIGCRSLCGVYGGVTFHGIRPFIVRKPIHIYVFMNMLAHICCRSRARACSMPRCERQILLLVHVVDGSFYVNDDRAVA